MIVEQGMYVKAAYENKEFELAGDHMAKQTGLKMVYNKILQIENNDPVVADEMLEAIRKIKQSNCCSLDQFVEPR